MSDEQERAQKQAQERAQALRIATALAEYRDALESVEVVGYPTRATELRALAMLVERYPEEARAMLAELEHGT